MPWHTEKNETHSKVKIPKSLICTFPFHDNITSVVVKDLRLKDKDKDLMSKDEDLKIGPRGSSKTMTFIEDNNTVA